MNEPAKRNPLHALCPYFAMFPESFVHTHVNALTKEGDLIFDPFSGRGTTLFQSLLMNREAAASDISPVAYCVSGAKADIPSLEYVTVQLDQWEAEFLRNDQSDLEDERRSLPAFFHRAFYPSTLRELLFIRRRLAWQRDRVHRFVAALALGSLHGEVNGAASYFSNQMPRTISTKPDYSLRYWRRHSLWPKRRHVFRILRAKAVVRLGGMIPNRKGSVALADVRVVPTIFPELHGRVKAIITSPPYFDVTNAEEDQWLRLWFLGGCPQPSYDRLGRDHRHSNKDRYWQFLADAWQAVRPLTRPDAVLVCRIGANGMMPEEVTAGLMKTVRSAFPQAQLLGTPVCSEIRKRQTNSFRPGSIGCRVEIDHTFQAFASMRR